MAEAESPDYRAIVAALPHEDRLAVTDRSDSPGLLRSCVHFGLIAAGGGMIAAGVPFWPLLLLPQGVLLVFLFAPLHETIHDTAFRMPALNRVVSFVSGALILIPPVWFRYFHFAHHRHTHDPAKDPELLTPKPRTLRDYAIYLSGIPYLIGMIRVFAANARGVAEDEFVPPKGKAKVAMEARRFLAFYAVVIVASLAAGSAILVWIWLVPLMLGQPFLRAYLLAEHTLCPHVADMFSNTRTTFTNRLVRFFAWNMPYHAEHHSLPGVPFHKLPLFHRHIR